MEELIGRILDLGATALEAELFGPPEFLPDADPEAVTARFARPDAREFYTRFNPQDTVIASFWGDMVFYEFSTIDELQAGYAFDANTGEPSKEWPAGMLVIGECSADPIMLNPAEEGEILYAIHGIGEWTPLPIAANIEGLLKLCLAWLNMTQQRGDALYNERRALHDESWALFERLAAEQGIDRQYLINMRALV